MKWVNDFRSHWVRLSQISVCKSDRLDVFLLFLRVVVFIVSFSFGILTLLHGDLLTSCFSSFGDLRRSKHKTHCPLFTLTVNCNRSYIFLFGRLIL